MAFPGIVVDQADDAMMAMPDVWRFTRSQYVLMYSPDSTNVYDLRGGSLGIGSVYGG